ncbi:MAG TPA: GNAT family N-acetyltransferase [Amnibacterium sp.]|jgi:GNAT superfamily N-acetyltransferase|uniref:GNAT family N-acetyltransferase n=1 Tax=Amnibacterium sp. TaxID=1872496 RepID=UPI002F9405EF
MTSLRDGTDDDLAAACGIAGATLDLDPEDADRIPRLLWPEDDGTRRIRLVAVDDDGVVGVLLGSLQGADAFLDLVAVRPAAQGRGIAGSLLTEWERRAAAAGAMRSLAGENLRTYAWPGVDVRYTPALALLLRRGYVRTQIVYNMDLPLTGWSARATDGAARLAAAGILVRRGRREDGTALRAHAERLWSEVWVRETAVALRREPAPIFLALRDDRVVGFAAHGIHRPSLYGPIATDPAEQGNGIGAVLSALCLDDMAARGVRTAQIGWVAEAAIPFYSRTAGARLGRCFWMMAKPLTAQEERG